MFKGNIYIWLLLLLFAASCSESSDMMPFDDTDKTEDLRSLLKIDSNIQLSNKSTKGLLYKTLPDQGKIGLFGISYYKLGGVPVPETVDGIKDKNGFEYNMFNACYTYDSSSSTLLPEVDAYYNYGSSACMSLYGYYPYNPEENSVFYDTKFNSWLVKWKQNRNNVNDTPDYLYMSNCQAEAKSKKPVKLGSMNHVFGAVEFYFYSDDMSLIQEDLMGYNYLHLLRLETKSADQGAFSLRTGKVYWYHEESDSYTEDKDLVFNTSRTLVSNKEQMYVQYAQTQAEALQKGAAFSFVMPGDSEVLKTGMKVGFGRNNDPLKDIDLSAIDVPLIVKAGSIMRLCIKVNRAATGAGTRSARVDDMKLTTSVIFE